ncbi:MAG: recombinase family protein [Bacilli bacterium]|nr:recombinase family protein [Bacilli bacterium]
MIYGYVRVSTNNQHIDRQVESLLSWGVKKSNILIDYESGKNFERNNYKKLIKMLKKNDIIVVKSIDRLGRDYHMIIEEWGLITKSKQANIVVIDMPLLDTRDKGNNLIGKFISDIVLQVLSFVAQNEREIMKLRQAEGIKYAKARGVKFGRPKVSIPNNFVDIASKYIRHEITSDKACNILNLTRGTFFRNLKILMKK